MRLSILTNSELENERDSLIQYSKVKLQSRDWHAVRDAMTDIEVIEEILNDRYGTDPEPLVGSGGCPDITEKWWANVKEVCT